MVTHHHRTLPSDVMGGNAMSTRRQRTRQRSVNADNLVGDKRLYKGRLAPLLDSHCIVKKAVPSSDALGLKLFIQEHQHRS